MNKLICVTGANGSIGSKLVSKLLNNGYSVRALIRSKKYAPALIDSGADVVVADLDNPLSIRGTLENCDIVFNAAARIIGNNLDEFRKTNVNGTCALLDEALQEGVKRFIQISSIAVYGYPESQDVLEDHPWIQRKDFYISTKQEAEKAVWKMSKNLPITIVRPGDVIGPDQNIWTCKFLHLIQKGLLHPPLCAGYLNPVYIDNLIDALIILGFHPGAVGEAFNIIDGFPIRMDLYVQELAKIVGRRVYHLPPFLLKTTALGLEYIGKARRSTPIVTLSSVNYLLHKTTFSNNKIKKTIDWTPLVNWENAIIQIKNWYRSTKSR